MNKRAVFLAALIAIAGIGFWLFRPGPEMTVTISQGESAHEIARQLKGRHIIRSTTLFRVFSKILGADRGLKPGIYHLRQRMSTLEAVWRLTRQRPQFVKVVIPEGFNANQIAERLEANGAASAQEFMVYVSSNRLEGYLFPTTYYLGYNMQAPAVAHLMYQEFKKTVIPEFEKYPPSRLSRDQVITLASIVQREAVLPEERPMIAAVYLNRLQKKKRLEADPTVQYAIDPTRWKKNLSLKDLQFNSPYNSYTHFGLPPTPICSPSVEAVRAVLAPAQTDAIYFVADNTGGHKFSVTYDEHEKAKHKAKRERRQKKLEGRR